jgi:hypothetical protein
MIPSIHASQEVNMSRSIGRFEKNCATCEFWGGSRKLSSFRDAVEYADDNVKGECVAIGGFFSRRQTSARQACDKWVKWSVLK